MSSTTIKLSLQQICRDPQLILKLNELAIASSKMRWHASNLLNIFFMDMDTDVLISNLQQKAAYLVSWNNPNYKRPLKRPPDMLPDEHEMQKFIDRAQGLIYDTTTRGAGIFGH